MNIGLILNLLNELNKSIFCESLVSIILFYLTRLINLVMNLNECNILFIEYHKKTLFHRLLFSASLTVSLYSANDVTSKFYYTSVITFLLNGCITLLLRVYVINKTYFNYMIPICYGFIHINTNMTASY